MALSSTQSKIVSHQSGIVSPVTFPLAEMPKFCCANEHMAPPFIQRSTITFRHSCGEVTRPYYVCMICNNSKPDVCRNCGHSRGFITWDDNIGLHSGNPRCYCGFPSRQNRKAGDAPAVWSKMGFGFALEDAVTIIPIEGTRCRLRTQGSCIIMMDFVSGCWREYHRPYNSMGVDKIRR
jgi:hypothetical protein